MPARRREPPATVLAFLDNVLASRARTRHAVMLMITCGVVLALLVGGVLITMSYFGVTGTVIAGSAGLLASAGVAVRRNRNSRAAVQRRQK